MSMIVDHRRSSWVNRSNESNGSSTCPISIVIVSFNSERFLPACLESALSQTVPFNAIVVIDNASTDQSRFVIETYQQHPSPAITLIAQPTNTGYAAAANTGIRHVLTDPQVQLILVANSDIILDAHFNAHVIQKFKDDPAIGMLSPLMLRFDRKTVDSAGQACSLTYNPEEIGFNRPLDRVDITEKAVFSVCGAATIFSRQALERLAIDGQYYDEDFFMFWEDFDIGWRAHLLGIPTRFYPRALVYHYRSGTLECTIRSRIWSRFSLALARPSAIKYHLIKNRYLTLIKNFRFHTDGKFIPFIVFSDMIRFTLLTFSSPKIIISLMKSVTYFKRAAVKRQQLMKRIRETQSPRII